MLLWQGGNYLVPLITLPYLSRVLGVKAFGDVAFSYAIVAYFALVTEWGFNLSSSRLIAQHSGDPADVTRVFWDTMNAKFCITVVSLAVLFILTVWIPTLYSIYPLILAASLTVVGNLITVNWCLQGLERLDFFAVGSLIGKLATIPPILMFVKGPEDATLSIWIQAGGFFLGGVLSIILLARLGLIGPPASSIRRAWQQIKEGWYVFLSTAAVNLYTTSNTVILGALTNMVAVGQYSGADRLKTAAQGVITPIGHAVYPRIAKMMREDEASAFVFVRRLLAIQGAATFLISLIMFIFAPFIIHLILGAKFDDAIPILRWLAWLPFLVGIGNIFGLQVLLQKGQQDIFSRVIVSAVPVSLMAIFPLVFLLGPIGAAIASVITEFYVTVAMAVMAVRYNPLLFPQWKGRG